MRGALPWVAVLAFLLAGWSAWRVHALSDGRGTDDGPPAGAAVAPPASRTAPGEDAAKAPRLASMPAAADEAAWRRDVEARLDALTKRLDASEADAAVVRTFVEEATRARIAVNERAALGAARQTIASQAQFQAGVRVDEDADGIGEYGGFVEMAGGVVRRGGRVASSPAHRLVPSVLHASFANLDAQGEATREGYLFRLYLPGAGGVPVGETAEGFPAGAVDTDLAESTWCVYAWPLEYGKTGRRTWFVFQGGDILWTDAPAYSGTGAGPAPDAARLPEHRGRLTGPAAVGEKGVDGNVWHLPEE